MLLAILILQIWSICLTVAIGIIIIAKFNGVITQIKLDNDRAKAEIKTDQISAMVNRKPTVIRLDDRHEQQANIKSGSTEPTGEGW
jgi:hypothetical protein